VIRSDDRNRLRVIGGELTDKLRNVWEECSGQGATRTKTPK
jgi:hypothetical protein